MWQQTDALVPDIGAIDKRSRYDNWYKITATRQAQYFPRNPRNYLGSLLPRYDNIDVAPSWDKCHAVRHLSTSHPSDQRLAFMLTGMTKEDDDDEGRRRTTKDDEGRRRTTKDDDVVVVVHVLRISPDTIRKHQCTLRHERGSYGPHAVTFIIGGAKLTDDVPPKNTL